MTPQKIVVLVWLGIVVVSLLVVFVAAWLADRREFKGVKRP